MYLTGVLVKAVAKLIPTTVVEILININYDGIGCVMSGMHMLPVYYTTTNTRKRKKEQEDSKSDCG